MTNSPQRVASTGGLIAGLGLAWLLAAAALGALLDAAGVLGAPHGATPLAHLAPKGAPLAGALSLYLLLWLLRARRFRAAARYTGVELEAGVAERAYLFGAGLARLFPHRIFEAATELALVSRGADTRRVRQAFSIVAWLTLTVEIGLFALIGLVTMGLGETLWRLLPGAALALTLAWVTRGTFTAPWEAGGALEHLRETWRGLKRSPHTLGRLSALSVLVPLTDSVAVSALLRALDAGAPSITLPFGALLGAVVAGRLATRVQLTPFGIGQRELAFALSLWAGGASLPVAASVALLDSLGRHAAGALLYWLARPGVRVGFADVLRRHARLTHDPRVAGTSLIVPVPAVTAPRAPERARLFRRAAWLLWALTLGLLIHQAARLALDLWLFEEQGFASVFWTTLSARAALFGLGAASAAGLLWAWLRADLPRDLRAALIHLTLMGALALGCVFARQPLTLLMAGADPLGHPDPFFGRDLGFYLFELPLLHLAWRLAATAGALTALGYALRGWLTPTRTRVEGLWGRLHPALVQLARPLPRIALVALGLSLAFGAWLRRFGVLYAATGDTQPVFTSATEADLEGLFSGTHAHTVLALAIVGLTLVASLALGALHRLGDSDTLDLDAATRRRLSRSAKAITLVALLFGVITATSQALAPAADEPLTQLRFVQAHLDATRAAYDLTTIERIPFSPAQPGAPLPDLAALQRAPALRNAPLWLARPLAPSAPLLDTLREEQRLQPCYDLLEIDTLRYHVDGEAQLLAAAVREVAPEPTSASGATDERPEGGVTHGLGLVIAHATWKTPEGNPVYISKGIPVTSWEPALQPRRQRIYYGEGADTLALTNLEGLPELDYPTDEGWAKIPTAELPTSGVPIDSLVKRLALGLREGRLRELLFSDLITDDTRALYDRQPLERLERIAPSIHFDADPFAVIAGDRVAWLASGISWTDRYPESLALPLGGEPGGEPARWVNYARDAVKATVDATTGQVTLYKIADEPIINRLAEIYPALFTPASEMPAELRAQLQYPAELAALQLGRAFSRYHDSDALSFARAEDDWAAVGSTDPVDDPREAPLAQGPVMDVMVNADGRPLPKSTHELQAARALAFSPAGTGNLRALAYIYQEGADYGRRVALELPKGQYALGPEQADAAIAQEPTIAQRLSLWSRDGRDVVRGPATPLVVGDELIYAAPIFLRAEPRPLPQMPLVAVVFRGTARMGSTLESALRRAVAAHDLGGR